MNLKGVLIPSAKHPSVFSTPATRDEEEGKTEVNMALSWRDMLWMCACSLFWISFSATPWAKPLLYLVLNQIPVTESALGQDSPGTWTCLFATQDVTNSSFWGEEGNDRDILWKQLKLWSSERALSPPWLVGLSPACWVSALSFLVSLLLLGLRAKPRHITRGPMATPWTPSANTNRSLLKNVLLSQKMHF